jgi:hypothetical protein
VHTPREEHRAGLAYLQAATALLQRARRADASAGLLEAADLQWWWRSARATDTMPQLFWFDDLGRPEAAVIATDWGDGIALDPIVMPDASPAWLAHVIERGLAHAGACGFHTVGVVIDRADDALRRVLAGHGFRDEEGATQVSPASLSVVCAWLAAGDRLPASPLHRDYRLCSRIDTAPRPHPMAQRNGPDVEARLRQTSLYRPELDLAVLDRREAVAAYALFWFDPATATGLVEPMRTEGSHQRRGLARHLLGAGIELLAGAGARRIKVCYRPGDAAARALYLGAGFKPDRQSSVLSGRAGAGAP